MTLRARLVAWVDGTVPEAYRAAPDALRRARLVLWILLVLESQAILFSILYGLLHAPIVSIVISLVGIALCSVPYVLRRSIAAAGHLEAGLLLLILDTVSLYTGGLSAPALFWTVAVPVLATLLGGRRAGGVWLGAVAVNATALMVATLAGARFENVLDHDGTILIQGSAVSMLAFVVFALAAVYESTKDAMLATIAEASDEMRRILDNVEQGFLDVDPRGQASVHQSTILGRWFGPSPDGAPFWDWIGRGDRVYRGFLAIGWEAVFDGVFPLEAAVAQLPTKLQRGERSFEVSYHPIFGAGPLPERVVVVVTDVSEKLAASRAEQVQRETAQLFERLVSDRPGFLQFWDEAQAILTDLEEGVPQARRLLHTLKGNAGVFGLTSLAKVCHEVEDRLADERREISPDDVADVAAAWRTATARIARMLLVEKQRVEVKLEDLDALEQAISDRVDHGRLAHMIESFRLESTERALSRLAEQASRIAQRLDRGELKVSTLHHGVHVDPRRYRALWGALVHLIRNAVDHGAEPREVRAARGKPEWLTLTLSTFDTGDAIVVAIEDDGAGIDWDAVRRKAARAGLKHETQSDLVAALFCDGLSTRDVATDTSGRGIGMGALADAAHALGGTVEIVSTPGVGTRVAVRVPLAGATPVHALAS